MKVPGFIYWLRAEGVGHIKIGYSARPAARMEELRVISPVPLRLIGLDLGSPATERHLHRQLQPHRLHGEWFQAVPEVFDTVVVFPEDTANITDWLDGRIQAHSGYFESHKDIVDLIRAAIDLHATNPSRKEDNP